jgi:hypothetical protein
MAEKQLDRLLVDLLKDREGVFLGEDHNSPSIRQAALEMLPLLKANGLGTVSLEVAQDMVDDAVRSTTWEEFAAKRPGIHKIRSIRFYDFVQKVHGLGIKVLGHDPPDDDYAATRIPLDSPDRNAIEKRAREAIDRAQTESGMKERDSYAAEHIRAHRSSKVLIIGGAGHSGNYQWEDLPLVKLLNHIHRYGPMDPLTGDAGRILACDLWHKTRFGAAYSGNYVESYHGLDAKLGYPSVDFVDIGWLSSKRPGDTSATDGKFNDYVVFLPQDLGQLRTTSLPAPANRPKKDRERAAKMSQGRD